MAQVDATRIGGALQLTIARAEKRNALDFATLRALAVAHAAGMDHAGLIALETGQLVDTWTHDDHWQAIAASKGRAGKR